MKFNEALKFIRNFNITVGEFAYTTDTIYYCYRKWSPDHKQERKSFISDFGKVFNVYKKGKYRYSNLNNFPEHLMAESLTEERRFLSASYKASNGKKKAKKEKKNTSGT